MPETSLYCLWHMSIIYGACCMARPQKPRRVCARPHCTDFAPGVEGGGIVIMSLDEYETIRLIDHEGMSQDECARQMEVARTTAQAIYARARQKLAQCLVQGDRLRIEGGDIQLCQRQGPSCGRGRCCARNTACPNTQSTSLMKAEEAADENRSTL